MQKFDSKILESSSDDKERYWEAMTKSFKQLPTHETLLARTKDVAVYDSNQIIGGISYIEHHPLSEDPDILKNWEIKKDIMGTRLLRFWTIAPNHRHYIMSIVFNRIMDVAEPGTFYYGILSVSLDYALKKNKSFLHHNDSLKARKPMELCQWANRHNSSSNGVALIGVYRRLRGELLGLPSGCDEDESVKIAMGSQVERDHFIGVIPAVE